MYDKIGSLEYCRRAPKIKLVDLKKGPQNFQNFSKNRLPRKISVYATG